MKKIKRMMFILAALMLLSGCMTADNTTQTTAEESTVEEMPTDHVELTPVPTEMVNPIPWAYVSDDNVQRVIFPDDAWEIKQKTDELVTFSKTNTGMVTLRKTNKANVTFPKTEEEVYTLLKEQGYEDDTYTVSDFSYADQPGESYWYRVSFKGENVQYASDTFRGVIVGDNAYEIVVMIFRDDDTLISEAKAIAQSFTIVLQDSADVQETPAETPAETAEPTAAPEPTATPIPEPTATPAPVFQPFYATCISSVSMRTAPVDGQIIGDIIPGTVVYVTGVVDNWYQFDYNGTVVYSYSRYFQIS